MSKKKSVNKKAVIVSILAGVPLVILSLTMIIIFLGVVVIFSPLILKIYSIEHPDYYPEEDLYIHSSIDSYTYEYQNKVCVKVVDGHSGSLIIRTGEYTENWFYKYDEYDNEENTAEIILSGTFDKTACHDKTIFIYMDDLFYTLDLNEYQVPKTNEKPEYEIKDYTIFEMDKLYPEFRDFDWDNWAD